MTGDLTKQLLWMLGCYELEQKVNNYFFPTWHLNLFFFNVVFAMFEICFSS